MTGRMEELADEIIRLQAELDREIEAKRKILGWRLKEGLVRFESGIVEQHQALRMKTTRFFANSQAPHILTTPVIYSMIIPFVLLDMWVGFYQAICFRAYGIPRVNRSDYIRFDRKQLSYLNWIETFNCAYCSYANGVIGYAREIASRTEQYWCPIKHAFHISDPHQRYYRFLEFGDAEGYRARLMEFRAALREDTAQQQDTGAAAH